MSEVKRQYNIPLRREFLKVPKYRRAKKSISAIRTFLTKHMKSENIKLGEMLNAKIWENGIRNPPHHVLVDVLKTAEGVVYCELQGFDIKIHQKKEAEKPKTLQEKIEEKIDGGKKKVVKKKATSKESDEEKPKKKVVKKATKKVVKKTTEAKAEAKAE